MTIRKKYILWRDGSLCIEVPHTQIWSYIWLYKHILGYYIHGGKHRCWRSQRDFLTNTGSGSSRLVYRFWSYYLFMRKWVRLLDLWICMIRDIGWCDHSHIVRVATSTWCGWTLGMGNESPYKVCCMFL